MNILKWLTKTANNTSVSRRSFLTGATTAAAVVAVPKMAESVEVETLPERMESRDSFKDGAVYCEIDGQWEYAGDVIECGDIFPQFEYEKRKSGDCGTLRKKFIGHSGSIRIETHGKDLLQVGTSEKLLINGKTVQGGFYSSIDTRFYVDLQDFPPDLYQSLNVPYPIMLEGV